jgi:PST family polysaccharide transporter
MFHWGLIGGTIVIFSILLGLPWGATGVAAAYSVVGICVVTPLLFFFVGRHGPVRTMDFYCTLAPSACAAFGTMATLFWFRKSVVINNPLVGLCIAFGLTLLTTLFVLYVIPGGRKALRDCVNMCGLIYKGKEALS